MRTRSPVQGMLTIARLNWPFYAVAASFFLCSLAVATKTQTPVIRMAGWGIVGVSGYFLFVSLAVSFQVYDRSGLYRWDWLDRALAGLTTHGVILCHAGFDETSTSLRERLAQTEWTILDHFDKERMTEPSIRRARRLMPPVAGTLPAASDRWPIADDSIDLVFGLLAIHELRSEAERIAWFAEAKRCLGIGGRIIIAEHTRDIANFLAFGPGFLHFHSRTSWLRCWKAAGLRLFEEFRPTWWVRVFVLVKP